MECCIFMSKITFAGQLVILYKLERSTVFIKVIIVVITQLYTRIWLKIFHFFFTCWKRRKNKPSFSYISFINYRDPGDQNNKYELYAQRVRRKSLGTKSRINLHKKITHILLKTELSPIDSRRLHTTRK